VPVFDRRGHPIGVRARIGEGGEGAVYEVEGSSELVAKLYHRPVAASQAAKLAAMAALQTHNLRRVAAWPLDTLHERPGGAVRGLLMPRVDSRKPIHQLYGPRSRLAEFPLADWRFLVRVATNLARAFAVVHAHGQVVGDVNQNNILVAQDGTVRLIDCDSFQIVRGDQRFPCDVGVSSFQPPELQALASFRGLVRTVDHDRFGLAVLLFHLLMLGRHPFAGSYDGGDDMPVERAIRELRFAYGRGAAERGLRPPPLAPTLDTLSPAVAALFERAFSRAAARGGQRPSAADWALALDCLLHELVVCPSSPGHVFQFRLPTCPWCQIERRAGTTLFPAGGSPCVWPAGRDLTSVWATIEAVGGPGPAPELPGLAALPASRPSALARRVERRARAALAILAALASLASLVSLATGYPTGGSAGLGGALVGASLAWLIWSARSGPRGRAERARQRARDEWLAVAARWAYQAGDARFLKKRRRLEEARAAYLDLPNTHRRRLQALEADTRERQRRRFLARHPIATAGIKGLGAAREAVLASRGVETAADVSEDALRAVPGVGRQLRQQILAWRGQVELAFVVDTGQGIDRRDLTELEQEMQAARRRLEQHLRHGAADLAALARQAQRARLTLRPRVERALAALARSEADCLPRPPATAAPERAGRRG
jgi:DNA-binding helix-hairpin-helix protein with protein kinase domain